MNPAWQIFPQKKEKINTLEELVEQLLINREIKTEKEREKFFNPQISDYKEDLNIPGIEKAKKRIIEAIKKGEQIVVFGDFDVDGVCSTAIMYQGLSFLGAKVLPYIPHREKEGYGLSKEGLKKAQEKGASLVVTVDNGIVALEAADFAKDLGIDLIITDHHTPSEEKPKAISIVHSLNLCGAGVAWCLIKQLIPEEESDSLLDLVAIATVADLISLKGINHALVKQGLVELNKTKRPGLLALFAEAGLERGSLTTYHIGFLIGPRLNAMGRMEHALDSLRLLCTKDISRARELSKLLSQTNNLRKEKTLEAISIAKQISPVKFGDGKKIVVLSSKEWSSGIIGLVAGKLSEESGIPAIIISEGETFSKGSARSSNGINIVETIRKCSDLLVDVGGHEKAAGFTVETCKIELLKTRIEEIVSSIEVEQISKVAIEALVDLKKVTLKWAEEIDQFEPFGLGNIKPVLGSRNALISSLRTVGEGKHLKFKIEGIDAIAFGMGNLFGVLTEGQKVDVAFYLEIDRFNGNEKTQLKILDLQPV